MEDLSSKLYTVMLRTPRFSDLVFMSEKTGDVITIKNLKTGAFVDNYIPMTLKAVNGMIIEDKVIHWDLDN